MTLTLARRPMPVPAPSAPVGARWPRAAVLSLLSVVAVVLAAVQTAWPSASAHVGPGVLSLASLVIDALVVRHMLRLDRASAATCLRARILEDQLGDLEALSGVLDLGVEAASGRGAG